MKRVWILNDLYVLPQARRGTAKALMNAAKDYVATNSVWIILAVTNTVGQNLYEYVLKTA